MFNSSFNGVFSDKTKNELKLQRYQKDIVEKIVTHHQIQRFDLFMSTLCEYKTTVIVVMYTICC